ncbi:MAG: bifunctional YncE family protein/alkaline phosphatase family protein [candidate division Zixibacteria bacterium]|nr:bifunctional YncE family protein/alkaline phosphatase family protein [candidate division Zixibacteria bacterium]
MKTKNILISVLAFILLAFLSVYNSEAQNNVKNIKVGPQADGSFLVPSNQILRPAGFQVSFPGRPVDLVLAIDKKLLVVKNRSSLDVIRIEDRTILQSLALIKSSNSFTGLSASTDGRTLFVSDARNKIHIAEFDENLILHWRNTIILPSPSVGGQPVLGGLTLNSEENLIYVPLSRNNSLAIVNLLDTTVIEIPVGIAPYEAVLLSDSKAYVSNWGGRTPREGETTYNTSDSQVLVDAKTGIANNGSVSVVDLTTNQQIKDIEVGLHPSGMIMSPDHSRLYVACANSDIISVINTITDAVVEEISVRMDKDIPFGSAPNALAISQDGKYLYVANGTDNAICVVQLGAQSHIMGFIPTGWYPGSLILDEEANFLFVANVKGVGSRNQMTNTAGYNTHDHQGTISIIPLPSDQDLAKMTKTVQENNSFVQKLVDHQSGKRLRNKVPVPQLKTQKSKFKHVVYIIKENRTYDQVFGDMTQGNGDINLVHFGREVTPNHHKLAETFILLDNFYCSGILSADGHQWTDEAYVTDYIEKFFGGFYRSYPYDGDDALAYASSGFIWDNVLRHGLTFRDYGEFVDAVIEPENVSFTDIYQDFINGTNKIKITAKANLEQLQPYLCSTYVGFPNRVPDIYRAAEFIKELKEYEKNDNFPNFIIMLLPNDHTSGTRPGSPTPSAAVADNDLALGQIVEAISHSKFWKETCIFVTEDDPQAGLDHVDGHRTVAMVISPYTKRNKVISTYYSQINMVRTMENILGIPPMNQFDSAAEPMLDCFTNKANFAPYKALPSNIPLDQLNPPLEKLVGMQLHWAKKSLEQDLADVDRIDEDTFNRIIWHAIKGYDVPYPVLSSK